MVIVEGLVAANENQSWSPSLDSCPVNGVPGTTASANDSELLGSVSNCCAKPDWAKPQNNKTHTVIWRENLSDFILFA